MGGIPTSTQELLFGAWTQVNDVMTGGPIQGALLVHMQGKFGSLNVHIFKCLQPLQPLDAKSNFYV